jgi:SPASM domain peptide maturase of grasp-with-spasm system
VYNVISKAYHKSINSIELILKYDASVPDEAYKQLAEDEPMISSLTLHSSPQDRTLIIDYGCDAEAGRFIKREVRITSQMIDSNIHCGLITVRSLHAPSITNFFETKFHNGCLNRKVAVDALGNIRNCPSMPAIYGNTADTNLADAIKGEGFKDKWQIRKDQVKVCMDCEFRYACSDCRAYVEDPADIYSKPLKCGYDPYTGQWEEWSTNPLKQQAIAYYGIPILKGHDVPGIQAAR